MSNKYAFCLERVEQVLVDFSLLDLRRLGLHRIIAVSIVFLLNQFFINPEAAKDKAENVVFGTFM